MHAHQRAKLERYGETLYLVLRTARYIDETETVEFGEVHIFAGPHFVITVRHAERQISPTCAAASKGAPICSAAGPSRSSTRSWTVSSTTTPPSSPG